MTTSIKTTTVQGQTYKYWADFVKRGMFAENEQGEVKRIHGSGYLTKDLSVRKAISYADRLSSFRK